MLKHNIFILLATLPCKKVASASSSLKLHFSSQNSYKLGKAKLAPKVTRAWFPKGLWLKFK